jgi:hypothetical protein
MKTVGYSVATALGGVVIATAFASNASAGCVDLSTMTAPVRWAGVPTRPSASPQRSTGDARSNDADESIVGLWQFQFTSVGNDGAPCLHPRRGSSRRGVHPVAQ